MPAIVKRKRNAPNSQKNTIQKFGKITKSQPAQAALIKQLELQQDVKTAIVHNSKEQKRKADIFEEDSLLQEVHLPKLPMTPRKKARHIKSNVAETPTKGARTLFQAFSITASEPTCDNIQLETPPPSQHSDRVEEMPKELKQMIDLHSCFLTALSLHYAHNGKMAPADLRNLCPNVARAWRVRKVEQKDIQRLLPLENKAGVQNAFQLTDYGHGKICVELVGGNDQHKAIDEKALNAQFADNLQTAWTDTFALITTKPSVSDFLSALPLADFKTISSISRIAASLSKGQQRLTEMKAGAIKAQERASSVTLGSTAMQNGCKPKSKDPFERSTDLKSRIFAKQQQNAGLPTPLTPEQMAHRSALMRLAEIAPVLESLALGRQKHRNDDAGDDPFKRVASHVSFTLPTLIQNMQMSLRNPIDKGEGGKCVRLLAEMAPEWIGIKEIGSVTGVTVGSLGVGRANLARRIEDALSKI